MLADKEQSFNILRGNIFQSQILCMAKLSRTKQCLLRHPCFKKGVLHKNERVKKKQKNPTNLLQNKKQILWGSGDGGASAERGKGDLQADDKGVLGGGHVVALKNTFSDESKALEDPQGEKERRLPHIFDCNENCFTAGSMFSMNWRLMPRKRSKCKGKAISTSGKMKPCTRK